MRKITTRRMLWWVPIGAAILFFGLNIGRTLRAPSPALARPADEERARRGVAPAAGADLRWPRQEDGRLVVGNAIVEPRGEVVRVAGSVPGRIARIAVREGARVERGQLLAALDDASERADLAAAEAEAALARAEADRVRSGSRREERTSATAAAARAESQAALSRGVYERTLRLHRSASSAVSLDQLERARRTAEADEQAARQASAERDRILNGARSEELRAARARLAAAEARLARARVQLAHRQVLAPSNGEVLRVAFRAGEYYLPGEGGALIELGETRRLHVRMEVDERDVGRIALGASGYVEASAFLPRKFAARVVELGRRMGRKQIVTGDLGERSDVKVLEVLLELEAGSPLVVGQRVIAYVTPR